MTCNSFTGRDICKPCLPRTAGNEGVGDVLEVGSFGGFILPGMRVVVIGNMLGTWQNYGVYHENDLYPVSHNLALPEAATLTIAPCMAYKMLKEFRQLKAGDTVIQNAANSAFGQCVIQLCRAWGINTYNIVASHCGYEAVKRNLLSLGASVVCTIDEAEDQISFDTSMDRPVLGFNCLGGRYENVLLKLLQKNGSIVCYGDAYRSKIQNAYFREDLSYYRFHILSEKCCIDAMKRDLMMKELLQLMALKKIRAPFYCPIELQHYKDALWKTCDCEAYNTINYIFDLTLP